MRLGEPVPTLEELFEAYATVLGDDLAPYRNHAYRVFHFARSFVEGSDSEHEKLAVAAFFHDVGIWTDRTLDYLDPSAREATRYLEQGGHSDWGPEVTRMIQSHHKMTSVRDEGPLVEAFRAGDWIDVTLGARRFGLPRRRITEVRRAFPNLGFHRRVLRLLGTRLVTHPTRPLPMMKW